MLDALSDDLNTPAALCLSFIVSRTLLTLER